MSKVSYEWVPVVGDVDDLEAIHERHGWPDFLGQELRLEIDDKYIVLASREVKQPESDDQNEFLIAADEIRTKAEAYLSELYGNRCPEFCETCICCQKWKALDNLLEDPFSE